MCSLLAKKLHVLLVLLAPTLTDGMNLMPQLHDDILRDYRPFRPVHQWNDSITVTVGFDLFQIKALDGKTQTLDTYGMIHLRWNDFNLQWNPDDYGGIDLIHLEAGDIWKPYIGLKNSASVIVEEEWGDQFPVKVSSTGDVRWAPTGLFQTRCDLNMFAFPFDVQRCSLVFSNLVDASSVVNLTLKSSNVRLEFLEHTPEFRLLDALVERNVRHRMAHCDGEGIPEILVWLVLKRVPTYYVINVLVPAMVLAILSTFVFLVPAESGEKLSLGITILLSFSVFLLLLSDNIPQAAEPVPFLVVYLTLTISISAVSILVQMIVLNMYFISHPIPLPKALRTLTRVLSVICRPNRVQPLAYVPSPPRTGPGLKHCSGSCSSFNKQITSVSVNEPVSSFGNTSINYLILEELEKITSDAADRTKEDLLKDQWRYTAHVLDRVFLVIFTTVHVLLLVTMWLILSDV